MNKAIIRYDILITLILLAGLVSATTVELSADKEEITLGEKVHLLLELNSKKKISGQLTVINLDEKRQEKILFQSVKPGCTCRADTRVSGQVSDESIFTPTKPGNYQARAYFDHMEKTVNFTVKPKQEVETTTTTITSTIIPLSAGPHGYVKLSWHNLEKCRSTVLGSMNTLNVDIGDEVEGYWASEPNSNIFYSCDGGETHPVNKVVLVGGSNVGLNQTVSGSYRLMVRCGRNTFVDDLVECSTLEFYLDPAGIVGPGLTAEETAAPATHPTTSTTTSLEATPDTNLNLTTASESRTREDADTPLSMPQQSTSGPNGRLLDWTPIVIGGLLIFTVLVGVVYKYLEGNGGGGKTRLEGKNEK